MLLTEGEILLILVKRDGRSAEEIAKDMGVDKSYLPRLYKMDKLTGKPKERALAVFDDAKKYFSASADKLSFVKEQQAVYHTTAGSNAAELERIQKEMAELQEVVALLKLELEQQKNLSANLAQTLANITNRS